MNKQREIIYDERKRVLFGEDLKEYVTNMTKELLEEEIAATVVESKYPEEWDLERLNENLKKICDRFEGIEYEEDSMGDLDEEQLREDVFNDFKELYQQKEDEIGEERMREVERMILIRVVDNKWMDHIDAMDQLKSGIGLRGLGGQDPAGAYATEGFAMFEEMIAAIKEETVKFCYNVTVTTSTERKEVFGKSSSMKEEYEDETGFMQEPMSDDMPAEQQIPQREKRQETVKRDQPKVGRNDPAPVAAERNISIVAEEENKKCCS